MQTHRIKTALRSLTLAATLITSGTAWAQKTDVGGTVASKEDGQPMPFVNISVKGTTRGTVSDIDGHFNLKVDNGDVLVFSFLDCKTQEIKYTGQTDLNVAMESDNMLLDEVVAVGYGTMKKSDLTGAVTTVKADALKKTPAANLDQALQGRAAGITVNSNSGQPGAAAEVRVRGIGSVVGDCSPIYVVDGVITSDISFLSPSDIASTEILKDASATAIYGSRGANGVILVTTKTGSSGKGNINVDVYWGLQNRWNKLDLMKRDEMALTKLRIDAMKNGAGAIATYLNEGFNSWMESYNIGRSNYAPTPKTDAHPNGFDYSAVDTDWQDELFRHNALIQSYSVSMDGGSDKGHYAFSGNYFKQEGTIIGSDFERFTIRVNADGKINDWLKMGEHMSYSHSTGRNAMNNNSSPGASIISAALAMAPWDPVYYPEGTVSADGKRDLSGAIASSTNFKNVVNPMSMVKHSHPEDKNERFVGDLFMEVSPIKGLLWRTQVSLDLLLNRNRSFKEKYEHSSYDKAEKNYISSSITRSSTFGEETTLTYSKTIGRSDFSIMAGQTLEEYNSYNIGGSGASILNSDDENKWYLNQATEDRTNASDGVSRNRRLSFLGRLHYSFAGKYLGTFNFRADGSSKFPENTWGYFPSLALAWRISEEDFLKDNPVIGNLKLRLGWGRVGNDKVGDDVFKQTVMNTGPTFVDYPLGKDQQLQTGATVLTLANTDGRWEVNEQWNAGIDFGVLDGHLNGSIDWFLRNTKDALLYVEAPAHVGNRYSPMSNVGKLANQGVEISLDYANSVGEVEYNIGGNVSFIKNELKELNGGFPLWGDKTVCDKGLAMNTFWGYEFEGVYQSDAEALAHLPNATGLAAGDARYKDRTRDGKIDIDDRTDLGNPFPWLTYGINLGASWKGFDLQMFFQGVYGNKIYNALRQRTEGNGSECTLSTSMRDVWVGYSDAVRNALSKNGIDWSKLENRQGTIPNPVGNSANYNYDTDRLIEDGAYFRLKNVQLGYSLPKSALQTLRLQKVRVYVSGSNLFTITDYSGFDPEVGGGVDYGNYPQSRTISFGLNMTI